MTTQAVQAVQQPQLEQPNYTLLSNEDWEALMDYFGFILEKNLTVQFTDPHDLTHTYIAVNSIDELIEASVFLGSHEMLFDGKQGKDSYEYHPAGTLFLDEGDRLELCVNTYFSDATLRAIKRNALFNAAYEYIKHMPHCGMSEGLDTITIMCKGIEAYTDMLLCLAGHGFILDVANAERVLEDTYQIDLIAML